MHQLLLIGMTIAVNVAPVQMIIWIILMLPCSNNLPTKSLWCYRLWNISIFFILLYLYMTTVVCVGVWHSCRRLFSWNDFLYFNLILRIYIFFNLKSQLGDRLCDSYCLLSDSFFFHVLALSKMLSTEMVPYKPYYFISI